ncbi:N-methyl-L-tryptophan oxidase [Roseibium marinum]|uniref:Sarcosine oxidase n=1 Tax=Roseibium marinum TaxID=281252 RepID=A0A2S3UN40_9HYPH|nr:N-methyl-L-tryptophan oxidase [Roseibium marinum]POF29104.1 sarcosine oxidase [Roseibium marinum]
MYDVVVVGLGAMGSAAVAEIAARGRKVLGIEARHPAHKLGSSHGDSRIIRLGYHEDPAYVPLLRRAYGNWRRLERRLGADILTKTGVLQIGHPDGRLVGGMLKSCAEYGLAHEILERAAMEDRFPGFVLESGEVAVLDPNGGYIRPETAIWGNLRLAMEDGAELHIGEKVTAIEPGANSVTIRSPSASYRARKVVVATGSWIAELVPRVAGRAVPIRQVVAWYRPSDDFAAQPQRMPCLLRDEGDRGSYFGFPQIGVDGVKIGKHTHFHEPIDPDRETPPVNDVDTAMLDSFAARRMPSVATVRVRAVTCRYTMLPGEDFLIDSLPGEPSVVVCSACSGHGFKFTSVIGEILADLSLDGGTDLPIARFSFNAHLELEETA